MKKLFPLPACKRQEPGPIAGLAVMETPPTHTGGSGFGASGKDKDDVCAKAAPDKRDPRLEFAD